MKKSAKSNLPIKSYDIPVNISVQIPTSVNSVTLKVKNSADEILATLKLYKDGIIILRPNQKIDSAKISYDKLSRFMEALQ